MIKNTANEILGVFEKFSNNQCTRDRALEDIGKIIECFSDQRSIVGYIRSGKIKNIFRELIDNKKLDSEKSYQYKVLVHKNEMDDISRILNDLEKYE